MKRLLKFVKDEEGLVAIEYALIAVFVALVIIVGVTLLGKNLNDTFNYIAGKVVHP
jgi:pilus assembly protein Flp/PilA